VSCLHGNQVEFRGSNSGGGFQTPGGAILVTSRAITAISAITRIGLGAMATRIAEEILPEAE